MIREIHEGRWLQVRGRAKRAWGRLLGNERLTAEGNADVMAGALEESVGIAKRDAERRVRRSIDRLANAAKRFARRIAN
jgi:uncharacterized protein YjbJ (UPF0337 family)